MAQYVKHNYFYSIDYQISNLGESVVYDTEIDLYYIFDNGDEEVETLSIGSINPKTNFSKSISIVVENKTLINCDGEVFLYD